MLKYNWLLKNVKRLIFSKERNEFSNYRLTLYF